MVDYFKRIWESLYIKRSGEFLINFVYGYIIMVEFYFKS